MQTLCFFDEFVEENQLIAQLGGPFGVLANAGVNELLEQTVLVTFIDAKPRRYQSDEYISG